MNLNFKQAISCYSLINSVIITFAPLTNQCSQAAIDASREDIDDMKSLLSRIGFSRGESLKYARVLVLKHKVNTVSKFQRKVGSDIAGYSATLRLDTDDVELLEKYFKQHMNVSTPSQLSSPGTAANSSAASAVGGASTKTPKHWTCFMVLSSPLDLVHASRLTCSSLT